MLRLALVLALTLLLIPAAVPASDGDGCTACHNPAAENMESGGRTVTIQFDTERFDKSVHSFLTCTDCHERFSGENFHFMPEGEVDPDVQAAADKLSATAAADPVAKAACLKCHGEIFETVLGSVHGESIVNKDSADTPFCADCHGSPHYVMAGSSQDSPVNKWNVVETCGTCHGDDKLMAKYGIESDIMGSYMESFHGKKHHLGHSGAPTCVDCHGAHNVKAGDDPTSPVFGTNKIATCDKCHPGANETFVPAITHKDPGFIPHYAEIGLILLVLGTIAFVILHFVLEAFSDIRDTLFRPKAHEDPAPDDDETVERFNIHFRVQHIFLFSTFLILAFTGWGLKYAEIEPSHWLIRLAGGAESAGYIHRTAGIIMVSTFLYHVLYVAYRILSGKTRWSMNTTVVPMPKDAFDLLQNFKYYLGLTDEPARVGRFNYKQKFDYWAVFWGMAIIGSSGVALAFPIAASALVPEFTTGWFWQLLSIMHSDEALLAVVFILFWHFYNEHLKPETFPMSWVWLTGKLTKGQLKHHHPLEYDLIKDQPGASESHEHKGIDTMSGEQPTGK